MSKRRISRKEEASESQETSHAKATRWKLVWQTRLTSDGTMSSREQDSLEDKNGS